MADAILIRGHHLREIDESIIKMTSLVINSPPTKTSYYYNGLFHEFFSPVGMVFTLNVNLLGMELAMPITPTYVKANKDRYIMEYAIHPQSPEGMSEWPEVSLSFAPDRGVEEGDSNITVRVDWKGQSVEATQPITVAFGSPTWHDLELGDRTWQQLEDDFDTWDGLMYYGAPSTP